MTSTAEKRVSLVIGKDFRALQEERVLQYKRLNEAHKIYLATGPSYELVLQATFKRYKRQNLLLSQMTTVSLQLNGRGATF